MDVCMPTGGRLLVERGEGPRQEGSRVHPTTVAAIDRAFAAVATAGIHSRSIQHGVGVVIGDVCVFWLHHQSFCTYPTPSIWIPTTTTTTTTTANTNTTIPMYSAL
eukprot:Filipodium_phascolosomae@DN5440_c0_g1_i1.p1